MFASKSYSQALPFELVKQKKKKFFIQSQNR